MSISLPAMSYGIRAVPHLLPVRESPLQWPSAGCANRETFIDQLVRLCKPVAAFVSGLFWIISTSTVMGEIYHMLKVLLLTVTAILASLTIACGGAESPSAASTVGPTNTGGSGIASTATPETTSSSTPSTETGQPSTGTGQPSGAPGSSVTTTPPTASDSVTVPASSGPLSPTKATWITTGVAHTCAVTTEGGVRCWGGNENGQLGDGQASGSFSPEPVQVVGLNSSIVAVSAGGDRTCALTAEGGVICWGRDFGPTPADVKGFTSGVSAVIGAVLILTDEGGIKRIRDSGVRDVVGMESGYVAIAGGCG